MNSSTAAVGETVTPPEETPAAPSSDDVWSVSPDHRLMVAQTRDGAWWMWDASTQRPVYLLNDSPRKSPPMRHPTFSGDGRFLAAISMGHVLLWEVGTRKRRVLFTQATVSHRSINILAFNVDGKFLASNGCEQMNSHMVCNGGFLSIWNTEDGTLAHTFATGFRVDSASFSSDGTLITASGCSSTDGVLGAYCYETATATYNVVSGKRLFLTRVPQFH